MILSYSIITVSSRMTLHYYGGKLDIASALLSLPIYSYNVIAWVFCYAYVKGIHVAFMGVNIKRRPHPNQQNIL